MRSESDPDWPLEPWTVQVLGDVRHCGYRPAAWARLLASSWQRARETAHREAALVQAWRRRGQVPPHLGVKEQEC